MRDQDQVGSRLQMLVIHFKTADVRGGVYGNTDGERIVRVKQEFLSPFDNNKGFF